MHILRLGSSLNCSDLERKILEAMRRNKTVSNFNFFWNLIFWVMGMGKAAEIMAFQKYPKFGQPLYLIYYNSCYIQQRMDLESAKMKFLELVNNIESPSVNEFFKWIQNSDQFNVKSNEDVILDKIVEDIRHLVPFDAILPDENLMLPSVGKVSYILLIMI